MAPRRDPGSPRHRRPAAARPRLAPAPASRAGAEAPAADLALMRARLAAMAAPREGDSPRMAALRAILRDEVLMAHVRANVEQWPPLSDEQRGTLGALLHPPPGQPRRHAA
jgi:hypothetical protein